MNDKSTENPADKDKSNGSEISRRGFLSSAALATVAGTSAVNGAMTQDRQQTNDRSKSDPGPTNRPLDAQNPDSEWPLDRDSHSLVPECASVGRHAGIICDNEFWNGI
jgi:hypothetical protein